MTRPVLTFEFVDALFRYDPRTGYLYNRRLKRQVGSEHAGLLRFNIQGYIYYVHRIAWLLHYGHWPALSIDHINGDGLDNRIQNLRQATHQQKLQNRCRFRNNKLGVKGVIARGRKFRAQLWRDGRYVLSKQFDTLEEAAAAYRDASLVHFMEFARLEPLPNAAA